jgi:hypothetical protein
MVGLGFELMALYLWSRCCTSWTTPLVHFALVILEMESCQLFALTDLRLWSSPFQLLTYLGLQAWTTETFHLGLFLNVYCSPSTTWPQKDHSWCFIVRISWDYWC